MAWIFTLVLILIGTLAAVIFKNRLVALVASPVMKPGDYYRYKAGTLYRL